MGRAATCFISGDPNYHKNGSGLTEVASESLIKYKESRAMAFATLRTLVRGSSQNRHQGPSRRRALKFNYQ